MSKRRSNGEGSYPRLKDGRIRPVLTVTAPDGTSRRRWFPAVATMREARAAVAEYRRAEAQNLKAGEHLTVGQYIDRWLLTRAVARGGASTVAGYEDALARLRPELGGVPLRELAPVQIQAAIARLTAEGYAPLTIRQTRSVLSTVLNDARRDRLIASNPVPDTTPPRAPRRPPDTFTAAQAGRLIADAEARGDPDWPLWALLVTTGLRVGEALGLRWADINLVAATLTVDGKVTRNEGPPKRVTIAKSASSHRTLPLTPAACRALRDQWTRSGSNELVFPSIKGRPQNAGVVRQHYYRALLAAGLPQVRPHGGRHTAATLHLRAGTALKVVSEMLGHRSIVTTANVYQHVDQTAMREAAERLDRAIFGPTVAKKVAGDEDRSAAEGA